MKKLIALLAATLILIPAEQASAHVFFTDKSGEIGVILHVTPDDDPVAGSSTGLFFDIQDKSLNTEKYYYRLYVIDAQDMQTQVAAYSAGPNAISSSYIFPSQGVYTLELIAQPLYDPDNPGAEQEPVVFNYSQRVSRGIVSSPLDQPRYAWAEFGMIATFSGLGLLAIIVFNRRKRIGAFTKQF